MKDGVLYILLWRIEKDLLNFVHGKQRTMFMVNKQNLVNNDAKTLPYSVIPSLVYNICYCLQ